MKSSEVDTLFHKLVDKYAQVFNPDSIHLVHEEWEHGEQVLAFENLLDGLQEWDIEVNSETREQLRKIAEVLGMLDNPSGKGMYW